MVGWLGGWVVGWVGTWLQWGGGWSHLVASSWYCNCISYPIGRNWGVGVHVHGGWVSISCELVTPPPPPSFLGE